MKQERHEQHTKKDTTARYWKIFNFLPILILWLIAEALASQGVHWVGVKIYRYVWKLDMVKFSVSKLMFLETFWSSRIYRL